MRASQDSSISSTELYDSDVCQESVNINESQCCVLQQVLRQSGPVTIMLRTYRINITTHTHTFRQTDPQKLNNDSDTRTHLSDDYIQRNSTHNVKTVSLQLHYQEHSVSQRYYWLLLKLNTDNIRLRLNQEFWQLQRNIYKANMFPLWQFK